MEWIKCSERIPEEVVDVLCFNKSRNVYTPSANCWVGWIAHGKWVTEQDTDEHDQPTHWMPLPPPPIE